MDDKLRPVTPVLILLYGFPGAGKTYFSRQFCHEVQAAHLEEDRVRQEFFDKPNFSKQENHALGRVMSFMTGEFLTAGVSVVYDSNVMRVAQRRSLRELARKHKASVLTVWFQVDADTAFIRNFKRDRRKLDDRFAAGYDFDRFKAVTSHMQHPEPTEKYLVVSGKHSFIAQLSGVMKKMADLNIVKQAAVSHKMVKPGLVNLVPSKPSAKAPQAKSGKRNIVLR